MRESFDDHNESESGSTTLVEEPRRRGPTPVPSHDKPVVTPPPRLPRKQDDDEEDEGFFQRHRLGIIVGVLVLLGGGWLFFRKPSAPSPVHKAPEPSIVRIQLPPPPPPPPPPPKIQPPPPKDDKRVEQTPMAKPEPKPEAPRPKPADKPEGLGTNNKGPGPGMAGLGNSGDGMLGGTGTNGGGGSMAKWYAGQVGSKIELALRNHRKTRSANLRVDAKVWVDGTGRVTRATLDNSSGDKSLDEALTNEILPGIQLSEPPPAKMRMPIPLRFNARRPN